MVFDSHQLQCLKGVLGPWRRVNLPSSPRWVHATEEMVVLVYAVIYALSQQHDFDATLLALTALGIK